MIELPIAFAERMKTELGENYEAFVTALSADRITSVRRNNIKSNKVYSEKRVPWCEHAFYLDQRPSFNHEPEFLAGCYYVQEASSMLVHSTLDNLELPEEPVVLDLCGAPGGKSTTVLDFLSGKGVLIANEVIKSRSNILKDNIIKWAHSKVLVTNNDPSQIGKIENLADVILVDAPCSGEGLFRKQDSAMTEWSQSNVDLCASRQKRILSDVLPSLRPGGYIIYSTCTYNAQENLDNVAWLTEEHGLETLPIPKLQVGGVKEVVQGDLHGYQCYPHLTQGEGFFISVLRSKEDGSPTKLPRIKKPKLTELSKEGKQLVDEWVSPKMEVDFKVSPTNDVYMYPKGMYHLVEIALRDLRLVYSGIKVGTLKGRIFIPSHELAMSVDLLHKGTTRVTLDKHDALLYLKKELTASPNESKGWQLVEYEGNGIGWLKQLGNRINNYLPNHVVIKR